MKYQIVCDHSSRLRLRFGKYVFTKEQCFGISDLLLSLDGVECVEANHVNGSVLIEYQGEGVREEITTMMTKMVVEDIKEVALTEEQKAHELEKTFKNKIIWHCTKHFLRGLLMPANFHRYFVCYRSISFLRMGLRALRRGRLSVEVLDATAVGVSLYGKSYKTASSTMFLLQLSELLLEYSNLRAKNALAQSLSITVDKVWLVQGDSEVEIKMADLVVGDVIKVRTGSMMPIDGTIVGGDALMNEATMTGEPLPVHKTVDGTVFAGTVVEDGEITVRVNNLNNESRIAKILELIDNGEQAKAQMQGKAERIADGIVPISLGLFLGTWLFTRNFARAASVLMVDFSCAIKLTTPITIISALKECVNHEVLVKGGKYLEVLSQVDTVVFDKTGTLTNAVPKVSKVIVMKDGYTEDKVLRIAACMEEHFPHSVASAIVETAKSRELVHPEDHGKVEYIVAHGIASSYKGQRSIIGSKHFIFEDEQIPYPKEKEVWMNEEIGSDSAVYLALDNELIGVVCVNDPPREDAKEAISLLRKEGIKDVIMITGDSEGNARHTSELLGIDHYYAAVLPDGKAELIEQLKAEGKTVLMVGDGINDAPALSRADVSLTMNGSSDIAREVADIAVLSDDLTKIAWSRRLATGLMTKTQNQYGMIATFNTSLILLGLAGILPANYSAWLHNASTFVLSGAATRPILPSSKDAQ
ncbi:MAG: heavy metal translocating P-type ATPase [Eubacteriales bacterium]